MQVTGLRKKWGIRGGQRFANPSNDVMVGTGTQFMSDASRQGKKVKRLKFSVTENSVKSDIAAGELF